MAMPVCPTFPKTLPFSTWAGFFAGLIFSQPAVEALGYGSGLQTFYHVIPYAFYAIAAVFLIPLFIFGIVPRMGLMKAACREIVSDEHYEDRLEVRKLRKAKEPTHIIQMREIGLVQLKEASFWRGTGEMVLVMKNGDRILLRYGIIKLNPKMYEIVSLIRSCLD